MKISKTKEYDVAEFTSNDLFLLLLIILLKYIFFHTDGMATSNLKTEKLKVDIYLNLLSHIKNRTSLVIYKLFLENPNFFRAK